MPVFDDPQFRFDDPLAVWEATSSPQINELIDPRRFELIWRRVVVPAPVVEPDPFNRWPIPQPKESQP